MKFRINSEHFWGEIHDAFGSKGGIYILFCIDDDDKPIPVGRLLGDDLDGVLYIGMASSFLDRVIELKKSLSPRYVSKGHECGSRHKSHVLIAERFPYEKLWVHLIESEHPRATEQEALDGYIFKFGELPPMNRAA